MTLSESILATLAYHDIFDYPLTLDQIHQYIIGKRASIETIHKELAKLLSKRRIVKYSSSKSGDIFYALAGKQKLFIKRKQRIKYSQRKLKKAHFYANILKLILTIKLVAVSGALAMENSHKDDDIDLVIITSRNTLWTTRFLANVILFPFKRKPAPPFTIHHSLLTNNKACLNIFIDESDLIIKDHNLYTAHEICQMKPLWDRDETYRKFIESNKWVKKFLPNWQPNFSSGIPASPSVILEQSEKISSLFPAEAGIYNGKGVRKKALVVSRLALSVESFLKNFQLRYMRSKITSEKIGNTQLFFHPNDVQDRVLREYQKRLSRLKIGV